MAKVKNQFGEFDAESPPGQPTKWKAEYNKAIVEYFDIEPTRIVKRIRRDKKGEEYEIEEEVANDFRTFEGFAASIDVNGDTLVEWAKEENEEKYPGFSAAYKKAKQAQHDLLVVNAMSSRYHPIFSIFVAKNVTNMRDKTEHEHTGKDGSPLFLPTSIVDKNKLNEESSGVS